MNGARNENPPLTIDDNGLSIICHTTFNQLKMQEQQHKQGDGKGD